MAIRRAIRARRRLMKLAPECFDVAVVERRAREKAEADASEAEFRGIAARIYGVEESSLPPPRIQKTVRRSSRTEAAIARELAASECWLSLGRESLQEFRRRRPHAVPSLSRIAALIELASRLGRLSTGLETTQSEAREPHGPGLTFQEALQRAYGTGSASAEPVAGAETKS